MENLEPKPKFNLKLLIGIILGFGLFVAGMFFLSNKIDRRNNLVNEKDPGLSDQQKKDLEGKVSGYVTDLQTVKKKSDQYYSDYLNLAQTYFLLGKYKDAESALDTIFPENQNDVQILYLYSKIHMQMQDTARAEAEISKAVSLTPEDENLWKSYINISAYKGKDAVLALYARALDATDDSLSIVTDYAKFAENEGDIDLAIELWKNALLKEPNNSEFQANLERLNKMKHS